MAKERIRVPDRAEELREFEWCKLQLQSLVERGEPISEEAKRIVENFIIIRDRRRTTIDLENWVKANIASASGRSLEMYQEVLNVIDAIKTRKR